MLKTILTVFFLFILNISLSYSIISIIEESEVKAYCNLSNLISFTKDFDNFMKHLPANVTKLTITCDNQNISLSSKSFPKNLSLDYLHFNGFSITMLPDSFKNLNNLKYLGFSNCTLRNLQVNPFGQLNNLVYLNLSSNAINEYSDLLIPFYSKNSQLNLSNNNISFLKEHDYSYALKFVDLIDIRNNTLACNCVNKWIFSHNFDSRHLKIDTKSLNKCLVSHFNHCDDNSDRFSGKFSTTFTYPFADIVLECPINRSVQQFEYWISPHSDRFGINNFNHTNILNHVKFIIQPLFIETMISVNETSYSLHIHNFRGYFRGNWTCVAIGSTGRSISTIINVGIKVRTKEMFDFSITIGFSFAGAWLLVAICLGLIQYCKETSCCRHKIDYNKSSLFEKRYVQTVIPVPFVDSMSESSSNDSDVNCSKPLNRTRYDSHNNDVQLIFKDQELADEYAQMLSQLKEASETGDENFKDRLTTLRTRFSIDFNKMRFELKRGMESLKSNSSAAAHKLRKSVGHMKDHMKSFTEFCGTSSMAQSISIVVISENPNTNDPNRSNYYHSHEKKVFHFFEPL